MAFLFKNSDGKPSLSFTMVYASFFVALVWFALSIVNTPHIKSFDVSTASGFLSPLLALYFGRKWSDSKNTSTDSTSTTTP